jgi:hypothetical protein
MNWVDYVRAIDKWERSQELGEREARITAYGWTIGTCGQRLRPDDAVKVKVAGREDRAGASEIQTRTRNKNDLEQQALCTTYRRRRTEEGFPNPKTFLDRLRATCRMALTQETDVVSRGFIGAAPPSNTNCTSRSLCATLQDRTRGEGFRTRTGVSTVRVGPQFFRISPILPQKRRRSMR